MTKALQPPPPERVQRGIKVKMDSGVREYIGRRLAELNTRRRRIDSEKKSAAAALKSQEREIDTESVSLESAPAVPNGKEVELIYPCEGRVNLQTGMFDIYVLERDAEGREEPRYVRSEALPEKYHDLFQQELPYDKPPPKDDPKKPGSGGKKKAPDFPGAEER